MANAVGRFGEGELDDTTLVGDAAAGELGLDGAELTEMLANRFGGDEPPKTLAGGDESLIAKRSRARRIVTRLAPNSSDSSASLGSSEPAGAAPSR